jgi:hypothetical protein
VVVDTNVYVERVSTTTRVEVERVGDATRVPGLPEGPLVASQEDTVDVGNQLHALTLEPTSQEVPVEEVQAGERVEGHTPTTMAGAGFAVVDVRDLRFKEIAAIEEINLRGQLETTRGLYLEARATLDEAVGRARKLRLDDLGKHMPQARDMLEEVLFQSAVTAREMDMTAVYVRDLMELMGGGEKARGRASAGLAEVYFDQNRFSEASSMVEVNEGLDLHSTTASRRKAKKVKGRLAKRGEVT